jgi:hypothetical protein
MYASADLEEGVISFTASPGARDAAQSLSARSGVIFGGQADEGRKIPSRTKAVGIADLCGHGFVPYSSVIADSSGNLYGTTYFRRQDSVRP